MTWKSKAKIFEIEIKTMTNKEMSRNFINKNDNYYYNEIKGKINIKVKAYKKWMEKSSLRKVKSKLTFEAIRLKWKIFKFKKYVSATY